MFILKVVTTRLLDSSKLPTIKLAHWDNRCKTPRYPKHPAWFHNLMANPDTTIQIGSRRSDVHARVADPQERERLWPKVVEVYGGYEDYRKRTDREIPLVILEPRQV